ncbi:hypothetical protein C1645_832812 [Glomus cerebriforme]|uniref:Uncharacterized protein n=1 Tax=Glomus cerebriforme TaxID=658196 RepID=A0A397SH81_9GLOM|nr:hypothetical protein C1645_832812 [Glomus cerebriforme]
MYVSQQYSILSYNIPIYNYLLDKLKDKYDKRIQKKRSDDYNENDENDDVILYVLSQLIKKIKKYYAFTKEEIYTIATEIIYKVNNTEVKESLADDSDDIFGCIFKKQKIDDKDKLKLYLNEKITSGKTNVLL